jgi:hypothetical protein
LNPLEQITLAWQSLGRALGQLGRLDLWLPWIALGAIQTLVLLAVWYYAHPLVSPIVTPVLRAVIGEEALHYPNVLRRLPTLYQMVGPFLDLLLGSLAMGTGTLLFAARFGGRRVGLSGAGSSAIGRAAALIVTQLPATLVIVAAGILLDHWVASRPGSSVRALIQQFLFFGVRVVVQSVFLFTAALVMLEGWSVTRTFAELPMTWRRGVWAALFLNLAVLLPTIPFIGLRTRSGTLVELGPERLGLMVLAEMVVGLVSWFVLCGAVTLVYASAVAEFDEWNIV